MKKPNEIARDRLASMREAMSYCEEKNIAIKHKSSAGMLATARALAERHPTLGKAPDDAADLKPFFEKAVALRDGKASTPAPSAAQVGRAVLEVVKNPDPAISNPMLDGIRKSVAALHGKERAAAGFSKQFEKGIPKKPAMPPQAASAIETRQERLKASNARFAQAIAAVDAEIEAARKTGKIPQDIISKRRELHLKWRASNRELTLAG